LQDQINNLPSPGITELSICGDNGNELCKLGSVGPGGGWIFFVDYHDQYPVFNYLEAALADTLSQQLW